MNLELLAMRWLRYEKHCAIVLMERSPRMGYCGKPDVLGITLSGYTYEIEVKRSVSDFHADSGKCSRRTRDLHLEKMPKQFYYLCPAGISDTLNRRIPEWSGLMRGPVNGEPQCARVLRAAPVNKYSKRLTLKECGRLMMQMASQIMSLAEARESLINRMISSDGNEDWYTTYFPGYSNFQI